ncbi:MAG: hypothetical protein AAGN35_05985 [Bacteroidota bacterium]
MRTTLIVALIGCCSFTMAQQKGTIALDHANEDAVAVVLLIEGKGSPVDPRRHKHNLTVYLNALPQGQDEIDLEATVSRARYRENAKRTPLYDSRHCRGKIKFLEMTEKYVIGRYDFVFYDPEINKTDWDRRRLQHDFKLRWHNR